MELFPYQQRVLRTVASGRPVILQAPTGSGKTRAALEPFFQHWGLNAAFPQQALYSVPMRTLANQFFTEYRRAVGERPQLSGMSVTIQTGERPEDPEFRGNLIFTTIDQTLSNWLCLPYAVGAGRANLNAGAVVASFLVFDEFHLFPLGNAAKADGALVTTLVLLRKLGGLTPWVLMTATFSRRWFAQLAELLGAEPVVVEAEELAQIPSQKGKVRRFHVCPRVLTAASILDLHERRSIAVVNTVDRAVALYRELCQRGCSPIPFTGRENLDAIYDAVAAGSNADDTPRVVLLHSRFEKAHRATKEELILNEFGPPGGQRRIPSLILIATQVIEVGLNISCERLHSEIAPAAAVIQRAGRCARFPGENGDVYLYDVPGTGWHKYLPYSHTDGQLCERAWSAFRRRDGEVLDFAGEQAVIDEVHRPADELLLEAMARREGHLERQLVDAIYCRQLAQRPELIRRISSRNLLVHDQPESLGDPFLCESFSISPGTLKSWWRGTNEAPRPSDIAWLLAWPMVEREGSELGQRGVYRYVWKPVTSEGEIDGSSLLAVHPKLVTYDAEEGFRFGSSDGRYRTPPQLGRRPTPFEYRLEDYASHVGKLAAVYERDLAGVICYVARRLEERIGAAAGMLDRAIRAALGLHDIGKLSRAWQAWAREYQQRIGRPVSVAGYAIVHTDCFSEEHRAVEKQMRSRRPPHAVEGAVCAAPTIDQAVRSHGELFRATLMAVARHHSADAGEFRQVRLDGAAKPAVAQGLLNAGFDVRDASALANRLLELTPVTDIMHHFLRAPGEERWEAWFAYFIVVRCLRLADAGALGENGETDHGGAAKG
jgi:CRISPR-associated endonuclease/helicase Cas3